MSQHPARTTVAAALLAVTLSLVSCAAGTTSTEGTSTTGSGASASSTPTPTPEPVPVSLDGEWKQSNSQSAEAWMSATITGGTIVVNWVLENGDTTALYWAGTVTVPQDGSTSFSWTSDADATQTANALLASSETTKDFTYDEGVISYVVTIQDQSATVEMMPAG